jgi:hypothetical protein
VVVTHTASNFGGSSQTSTTRVICRPSNFAVSRVFVGPSKRREMFSAGRRKENDVCVESALCRPCRSRACTRKVKISIMRALGAVWQRGLFEASRRIHMQRPSSGTGQQCMRNLEPPIHIWAKLQAALELTKALYPVKSAILSQTKSCYFCGGLVRSDFFRHGFLWYLSRTTWADPQSNGLNI